LWGNGIGTGAFTTVGIKHVLETFLLTKKTSMIKSGTRRQIKNSLDIHRLNLQAATEHQHKPDLIEKKKKKKKKKKDKNT
jgi:hypothetical protein